MFIKRAFRLIYWRTELFFSVTHLATGFGWFIRPSVVVVVVVVVAVAVVIVAFYLLAASLAAH